MGLSPSTCTGLWQSLPHHADFQRSRHFHPCGLPEYSASRAANQLRIRTVLTEQGLWRLSLSGASVWVCLLEQVRTSKASECASKDPEDVLFANADSESSLQRLSAKPHFASPNLRKVLPAGVQFFDQRDLLFAPPAFDLFFAADGNLHVLIAFVIDQTMTLIFLSKTLN